jgi:DNA-binding CsgD family transcriptional regulator
MNDYQMLHLSYPVLALTILSFILICFYFFLWSVKGKGVFLSHFGFIVLVTIENIMENLLEPSRHFPPNIREATGYIISAFWPYYVYKLTNFPAYKHYIIHCLFIMIPTLFFFFIFYPFLGSFSLARKLVYFIPACYGLYAIPIFFISANRNYKAKNNKEQFYEYMFLIIAIIFWAISPIVRIYFNGSRSAIGIVATAPLIFFNIYIIVKELKLLVRGKTERVENESNINLSNYTLTLREAEVIEFAYQGKTYKEIGKELFISEARVKQIAANVYKKLGVENKLDMVKKLKRNETVTNE